MAKRKARKSKKTKTVRAAGLTRPELAKAFKVTPGTITRWERDGMPVLFRAPRGRSSLFDEAAVRAWRTTVDTAEDRAATFSLSQSRARQADKQTEKLDLEIALKRGETVHRDQVVREGLAFARGLAAKLRALPKQAEYSGVIEAAQVPGLIALVNELLLQISQWKTIGDLPAGKPPA